MTTNKPAALAASSAGTSLSLRTGPRNTNHHLWRNHGTWWLIATVPHRDHTKQRLRTPLKTKDIHLARRRREPILAHFVPCKEVA